MPSHRASELAPLGTTIAKPAIQKLNARQALALRLYSMGVWAAQPLLKRKLKRRSQTEIGYAEAVPERFGFYEQPAPPRLPKQSLLWVHAVSLGESRAAGILLKEIRQRQPTLRILLTHSTATGRAEGKRLLAEIGIEGDCQAWLPWDTRAAVTRFLQHFQPTMGVLMETEVWPNLTWLCAQANIPLWLVNARLNEKSLAGAQRFPNLLGAAYQHMDAVIAQTEMDTQRLAGLGANVIATAGNLKFDEKPSNRLQNQGKQWRSLFHQESPAKPIIALASSREGEEAQWLTALAQLSALERKSVQWLVIARHPQRFDEVARLIENSPISPALTVSRRSQWITDQPPMPADVWLGDSMGEMALYYSLSDIALLGASFEKLGGQNLIEACACACPVILGPHTFNFEKIAQDAIAHAAAERAQTMHQAVQKALRLVQDRPSLAAAKTAALQFSASQAGAGAFTAEAILEKLKTHADSTQAAQ